MGFVATDGNKKVYLLDFGLDCLFTLPEYVMLISYCFQETFAFIVPILVCCFSNSLG